MRARTPFAVIPWQDDFLGGLLDLAMRDTDGDISKAVFIFPHSRPRRYLSLLLRRDARLSRPLLMPDVHTISGLFTALAGRILARPAWKAERLDLVGLLLDCARREAQIEATSNSATPFLTDARLFFPWGTRLASLYEECFAQHKKPADFLYAEGQVSPFAAMLLSRLGRIFTRYVLALQECEWTTPGLDASLVADYLQERKTLPPGSLPEDRPLYIAGFHALTGTEETLFRHLWERLGARVVIHADPALAATGRQEGGRAAPHWSCAVFEEWGKTWSAAFEPAEPISDKTAKRSSSASFSPRIRYFQGFDLHSQLAVLREELADMEPSPAFAPDSDPGSDANVPSERPRPMKSAGDPVGAEPDGVAADHLADTVVALPDGSLLMPVLHHLPHTDINVSMGYPLTRSPLFRLVDTLARLQEGRKPTGYYWRDLVDLIRHPYLKMLSPMSPPDAARTEEKTAPDLSLRGELHRLEQELRGRGRKYAQPGTLLSELYQMFMPDELPPAPVLALLDRLFRIVLDAFENPRCLKDLAEALQGVCSLLLECGQALWTRFPIDAECLYRLRHSLVPALASSRLSAEAFPPETLFAILRELLETERVPFEADPLVGLQIMGMLETRLLSFRRVAIVDAVEDALPGSPVGDPLLPEALRSELGLPSLHARERIAAYHFFRLIAGAEDVLLFWQEGGESSGIQEQKKTRSRFVEELLWNEEKRLNRLLASQGQDGPLTVLGASIRSIPRDRRSVPVSAAVRGLLDALLNRPISASLLDSYLRCPVRFFHERAARLVPLEDIREGDDPLAVGELFHQTLQDAYSIWLNIPLPGGEALAALMREDVLAAFAASPPYAELARRLPADALTMLILAGKKRLADFLLHQPPTTVLALETQLRASFTASSGKYILTGKADRIDARLTNQSDTAEAGIVILDYKTGNAPKIQPSFWEDDSLWQALRTWTPELDMTSAPPLPHLLAERLDSVQLPFYLLLYSLAATQGSLPRECAAHAALPVWNAVWVELGNTGEEIPLFADFSAAARQQILEERIPELVHFLLRHIRESRVLKPRTGPHCGWCSCEKLCKVFSSSKCI